MLLKPGQYPNASTEYFLSLYRQTAKWRDPDSGSGSSSGRPCQEMHLEMVFNVGSAMKKAGFPRALHRKQALEHPRGMVSPLSFFPIHPSFLTPRCQLTRASQTSSPSMTTSAPPLTMYPGAPSPKFR
jgi:hypothetical protein